MLCRSILLLLLLLLLLVLAADGAEARRRRGDRRPNFVLLFVDDLGYGDLGFNGHPTTQTPNLDRLAFSGKTLTSWYSGCSVCTGSRSALMTGRQFPRTGLPGVLGPTGNIGLPLNETTIATHLQRAGYATAIVGKWHLGQRHLYLPGNRGFDHYLGIPYSDDMGSGIASSCPATVNVENGVQQQQQQQQHDPKRRNLNQFSSEDGTAPSSSPSSSWDKDSYDALGLTVAKNSSSSVDILSHADPAGKYLPLVYQFHNATQILEQPLDFTNLAQKYKEFTTKFIDENKDDPFFLYVPFSHVHMTNSEQPEKQYSGCDFKGSTRRGAFGDALAETDWLVGNIVDKLKELDLEEDTLILFTSDNGPWLHGKLSAGSEGLFTGRYAGYSNTAKGSTWEGGIRMPAFAHWKGKISPLSRSAEVISSMDVFPTLSALAGLELPPNRTYDGRDFSDILLSENGKSKHDFLFFYGRCSGDPYWSVSSVRHGKYKAHWCTAPGLGGGGPTVRYNPPLLFDVEKDPSEEYPISSNEMPKNPEDAEAMQRILKAYAMEKATFQFGHANPYPDGPEEGPGRYGLCCDRKRHCNCGCNTSAAVESIGIFNLGTKKHHDRYHEVLQEKEPYPPRTRAQMLLKSVDNEYER